jgi:transposase
MGKNRKMKRRKEKKRKEKKRKEKERREEKRNGKKRKEKKKEKKRKEKKRKEKKRKEKVLGIISLICFSVHLSFVSRRTIEILEFILHPVTLLKVFISCRSSLVEFLESIIYTIISSSIKDSLLFFPFQFLSS